MNEAKILLPMNSDGKSIHVTGPAVIQAPNMSRPTSTWRTRPKDAPGAGG